MTQESLRSEYINKGYTVDPVENWFKVSVVDGVEKYDVNVITPDERFVTAQVIVRDGEASVAGVWKEQEVVESFTDKLRAHVRTLEGGAVFAISLGEVSEADKVGLATVYFSDGSTKKFVVKERNGSFTHKELL